jgi:2,3-bisphosphoglycerate-dependent phosphoglycerate mutase
MTTVYLIRHAEPDFSIHDDRERPLTIKGKESCSRVIEYLEDKNITRIFSSPYRRAVDTVQGFADTCGLMIELIEELRERAVDTVWIENFTQFVHNQWMDFDYKLEGGESLRQVQSRCITALEAILSKNPEGNLVVGSHGTAISTIIHYYDRDYGEEHFNQIRSIMPFIAKMEFDFTRCKSIEIIDIMGSTERKVYQKIR